ncbi:MAG: Cytochrome P450, partial [uncultured Solirubrobacteraceae bacterium]
AHTVRYVDAPGPARPPLSAPAADDRLAQAARPLDGALPRPLRRHLHHPDRQRGRVGADVASRRGAGDLHGRPGAAARRQGESDPAALPRAGLGPAARRLAPPAPAQADAAALPRGPDAPLRVADGRRRRAGGGDVAGRRPALAHAADAGADHGDHPARGVRDPRGRAARAHAGRADADARVRHPPELVRDDGVARPGEVRRAAQVPQGHRPGGRAPARRDPLAPRGRRPGRAGRHHVAAAAGHARGRLPDGRLRAARRAAHPPARGPRDDGDLALLGARAPAAPPGRLGPAARRGGHGRDGLHRRDGQGDAAPAPRPPARRPRAPAADGDRRAPPPGRRARRALHLPHAPPARALPRARGVPPGALPRPHARDVHVDPVRRGHPPLPRGELRAVRDEHGARRRRAVGDAARGPARAPRARRAAGDHAHARARRRGGPRAGRRL